MSIERNTFIGTISAIIELKTQPDGSKVYQFELDTLPTRPLTCCVPERESDDTPKLNQRVMVTLFPADSAWPNHAQSVITDVPSDID